MSEIFTVDNLLHSIVAVAFVTAGSLGLHFIAGHAGAWAPVLALLAGIGLYLREAAQVHWDMSLRGSFHKWCEALVGTLAGFIVAAVFLLTGL